MEMWPGRSAEKLDEIDAIYKEMRTIDEKTYPFICFALAMKALTTAFLKWQEEQL